MKFIADFFPILLFFGAYHLYDIYVATAVAVVAAFVQVGYQYLRHLLRRKPHVLSPKEEALLAKTNEILNVEITVSLGEKLVERSDVHQVETYGGELAVRGGVSGRPPRHIADAHRATDESRCHAAGFRLAAPQCRLDHILFRTGRAEPLRSLPF